MYHKESGSGNNPFLAGNMLCRRRSLSPRISALINLPRLFLSARETYHLDRRCTLLPGALPELCTFRALRSLESRSRRSMRPYESQWLLKPRRGGLGWPLLSRRTNHAGKHRVADREMKLEGNHFLVCLSWKRPNTCCDDVLPEGFSGKDFPSPEQSSAVTTEWSTKALPR